MNTRLLTIRLGLALTLALAADTLSAQTKIDSAEGRALIAGDFDIGGQKKSVSGSKEKFQEYSDLRDGFLVNEIRISQESEAKPYFFDFKAKNATRADESYDLNGGAYGKWNVGLSFDRTPHNFNKGIFILSGAGTSRMSIANQIQAGAQASELARPARGGVANTDVGGLDAAQQAIIRNLISVTDPTVFKLERERGTLNLGYNITPDVKTWTKVSQERRQGSQLTGAGTYERYSQGAAGLAHTEDQFVATGMELAEAIDYRTTTLNAGGGIYKKGWMLDAEYTFTDFDNGNRSLIWGNPFRNTDAAATNNAGASLVLGDNGFGRGRFVNGQKSVAPSSQSHDIAASGSVELPLRSRFTGSMSYGVVNQNEDLLPYTLNSAIGGVAGAPANITDVAALPVSRFNGEIRTLTQSFALTTKPLDSLSASLKYRYYDYANHSDRIVFPGYAAFGESYWRVFKNDPTGANDALVRNEIPSYLRQTAKFAVDYHVAEPLTLDAETFWDGYNHKQQRIDGTDEVGAGLGFLYKVGVADTRVHGSYKYAHRAVRNYKRGDTAANPEAIGLANFNWADRIRQNSNLRVDFEPVKTVTVGLGGQYQDDAYGAGERFGLKSQKNLIGSVDVTYEANEKVSLTANFSREHRRGRMQSAAKDDAFNGAGELDDAFGGDNYNPYNYWDTAVTENVDTFGLEAVLRPIPEKMLVNLGYAYSQSRMRFDTSNPNAGESAAIGRGDAKLANGAAQVWPAVVNRTHEVRAGGSYELIKDLRVGLNYLFAWYTLDDFTNSAGYLAGSSVENSTRFLSVGANNYDYTAHVVGTYLAYKF